MIIYQESKSEFIKECDQQSISDKVASNMRYNGISSFKESQINAWKYSLPAIADVLKQSDTDSDIDVAIEYKINQSRDRIDFLIYGQDESNKNNVIIIELKQWSSVTRTNKRNFVHTFGGGGEKDYWHPSYQAKNYANLLYNFNEYLQENDVSLRTCAYLHNMDNGNIVLLGNLDLFPVTNETPVFLKDDADKLSAFISKYVKHGNKKLLYEIENSRVVPSRHLADMLKESIEGNDFFSYDEAQANAVSEIVRTVEDAIYYNEKKTIIIRGGAGTGKSVVAINVLGQLISGKNGNKYNAVYCTANASPRYLYAEELINNNYKKNAIKNLFKYPTVFVNAGENIFDCAIIDEGHRIFDFKGGVGIKKGTHILEEIIKSSRISVFFIDEDQAVLKIDYATIDRIKETAKKCHSRVIEGEDLELTTQFRVLGGENYIGFIKSFLGYNNLIDRYNVTSNYDFRVFDSASEMQEAIREKDELCRKEYAEQHPLIPIDSISGRCRMVAGYTYEWVSKNQFRDGPDYDIVLDGGQFKAKWNLRCKEVGTEYSWVSDPLSVDEVGCIHTCQGLDMNYCGVIIGKDLLFRNGKLCFDKSANAKSDQASQIRTTDDETAQKLIRNTYNVLLTRGMKGTYVYCEDKDLRDYLKSFIKTK